MDATNACLADPIRVLRAKGPDAPLVFSSPHGGTTYPDALARRLRLAPNRLKKLEDGPVERLLLGAATRGAQVIWTELPRAFVDPNRHPQELDPASLRDAADFGEARVSAKTAVGLGVVPTRVDGRALYSPALSAREALLRVRLGHAPFHRAVARALDQAASRHGVAFLLDCHSMPSFPGPDGRVEVALGDRHGRACDPALAALVKRHFEEAGLVVGMNAPFAGGYVTERHGEPERHRHALQIELRRALFLDEQRWEPHDGMRALAGLLTDLAGVCAAFLPEIAPPRRDIA